MGATLTQEVLKVRLIPLVSNEYIQLYTVVDMCSTYTTCNASTPIVSIYFNNDHDPLQ